jgi:nucleoside-diphosphate-sugar epimerase
MTVWITDNLGVAPCNLRLGNDVCRLDVRDLVDKKGNDLRILQDKIKAGLNMLREGRRLVVCCDLGVSRSVAISVGIMSLFGKSFEESVRLAAERVKNQDMNLDLLEDVRRSIGHTTEKRPNDKKTSRILIIGSEGFIGKAIIKKLSGEYSLYCPGKSETELPENILSLYSEVRSREIDLIVDLSYSEPQNLMKSLLGSVATTRNILEVGRLNDVPVLFFSTLLVFEGYGGDAVPTLKSELEPRPASIYGQGKALCEELIEWYRRLYQLRVTTLRLPYVYGKSLNRITFLRKLVENATKDEPITIHRYLNGFQRLDFLHIDDLIEAIERAIHRTPSENINLGSGIGTSTLDLAKLVVGLAKSKSKINVVDVKDRVRDLVADTAKARESLDWEPKANLTSALRRMLPNQKKGEQ